MVTHMTSRQFNQDTSGAKRAADRGPVVITDRGRPAHVLISYDEYEQLLGRRQPLDLLAEPPGVEDIDFVVPASDEFARPADID